MADRLVSTYLSGMEDRLSRPTMSLPTLAILTALLCVFVVPAVIALSMIVFPPMGWTP